MLLIYQDANQDNVARVPKVNNFLSITVYDTNTHIIFLKNYSTYLIHFDPTASFVLLTHTLKQVSGRGYFANSQIKKEKRKGQPGHKNELNAYGIQGS